MRTDEIFQFATTWTELKPNAKEKDKLVHSYVEYKDTKVLVNPNGNKF